MADLDGSGTNNMTSNDSDPVMNSEDDGSITIEFTLWFNVTKCGVWWLLFILALAYALARRKVVSRAWFIYTSLLAVIVFNGIQTSSTVGYASHVLKGHSGLIGRLISLFFFDVSRSAFLAVLMVVASGYCITRSDLGPHKQHVVFVPTTVLVTGLVTDFSFFALASSPDTDTYDLTNIGAFAAAVWFVCSVLNLSALILAWLYIFEALGKETSALEEEYQRRTGKLQEAETAAETEAALADAAAGRVRYNALGTPGLAAPEPQAADPEAGGLGEGETVADHIAYTNKKKLLSRFAVGVAAYLVADICVLLLPAFFLTVVQSTLQVLLFGCYFAFVVVLLVLFRPQEQSSYLMVGFSEEDAEKRGVNQLLTGIAMGDLNRSGHGHSGLGDSDSDDDEIGRLRSGPTAVAPPPAIGIPVGPPAFLPPSSPAGVLAAAGAADGGGSGGPSKASLKTAAHAVKQASKHSERYGQLPSAPPPSTSSADRDAGAGALPVSRQGRSDAGAPSDGGTSGSGGGGGLMSGVARGRQPRAYHLQQAPPSSGGQFTLGDDDEDDDAGSRLLAREKGI